MGPVLRKLECGAALSADDRRTAELMCQNERSFGAREDVIREGEQPQGVHAVLEGFACRYKLLPNGSRQILAWLIPGDFCDLHVSILGAMDHGIATLSPCRIAYLPQRDVEAMTSHRTNLTRALWWSTLVDEAVLRQWLVGVGRRSAEKQVAHLICELLVRLRVVGLVEGGVFDFPITQGELADAVGLTAVHVNRVVQHLRHCGLIRLQDRTLAVLDEGALRELAEFNANYLHLGEPRSKERANSGN